MRGSLITGALLFAIMIIGYFAVGGKTTTPAVVDEKESVESYLRRNISTLSPVKAVLGGTWYVVSDTVDLEKNTGTVTYEDGHIQEKKDFSYTTNGKNEVLSMTIK